MSNFTPTGNLVRNMEGFMTWRSLNHPTVAKRMENLGFTWWPKTVYRVLAGDRHVRLDELYGLALVFETTVGALLDPATAEPRSSEDAFPTGYEIMAMEPIGLMQFRKLLEIPEDRLDRAGIGVRSWASEDFVDGVPQWKPSPLSRPTQTVNAVLRSSGWASVDEVLAAHPEGIDTLDPLLYFIVDNPNRPKEVSVS